MDKELSRILFRKNKIKTPKYFILHKDYDGNLNRKIKNKKIKFPIVIKPINEGSSLGVYICKNKIQFNKNYNKLRNEYNKILVEEYIPGKEIQVAVMCDKALGAIELIPKREFYDYKAKYSSKAKTKHVMPASLSRKKYKEVLFLARKAHKVLRCRGITRSDFRFFKDKFYLLETNTQPGMTKLSLVPEIAHYCGIKFEDLVVWMARDASNNR
jgi:D-alanine-D-alanine ligase